MNYKELLIDEKLQKMFITTVLSIASAHPQVRAHPPNFDSSVVCEVQRVTTHNAKFLWYYIILCVHGIGSYGLCFKNMWALEDPGKYYNC